MSDETKKAAMADVMRAAMAHRVATMAKGEYEMIMYGRRFWPHPLDGAGYYTYDQACAACWQFYEINQLYTTIPSMRDDHAARAGSVRDSTKWFAKYADRAMSGDGKDKFKRVLELVCSMADAMEKNPEGESRRPPAKSNDGEWGPPRRRRQR